MKDLLRERQGEGHGKVTYIELFFDLVFVFAITQVSHALIADFSPGGVVQALLLMLATWWLWIYTSWFTNWLDPERIPVRVMVVALMLGGLVFSASLPKAFATRGASFAAAYVACSVGRAAFVLLTTRGHEGLTRNYQRILSWHLAAAVFWIVGIFQHDVGRLLMWALALAIDMMGPVFGFGVPGLGKSTTRDWDVEGAHMAERCALFVIIALGESLLVSGARFTSLAWTAPNVAAFAISFVTAVAMWWLYFDAGADAGSDRIAKSSDPGKIARLAYTYVHLWFMGGIILAAVANEYVLRHPLDPASPATTIAILGGNALYLVGNSLFKWSIVKRFIVSHGIALAVLGGLAFAAPHVSSLVLSGAAMLVLVATALSERKAEALEELEVS